MKGLKLTIFVLFLWCMLVDRGNTSICDSKISVDKSLAVANIDHIEQRAKYPCLGAWIKQNIRKEHPLLSFPLVALLSLRISHLLQAAQVGCYGSKCSAPCLKVRASFQDLMYSVARDSDIILKQTIQMIRAHRYALLNPSKAVKAITYVERTHLQNVEKVIANITQIAGEQLPLAAQLHQQIVRIIKENEDSLKKYKEEVEKMKKGEKASGDKVEEWKAAIVEATASLETLKVKLDVSANTERKLKMKRDEYIACHNRQLAEKHEFEEKLAEFNRKKEAAVEKKTEECYDLRRKLQDLKEETEDDRTALEKCAKGSFSKIPKEEEEEEDDPMDFPLDVAAENNGEEIVADTEERTTAAPPATTQGPCTIAKGGSILGDAGACCDFPFIYSGKIYNKCTKSKGHKTPWCFTKDKKWGYCQSDLSDCVTTVGGTAEGACCTFPFEDQDGVTHTETCAPETGSDKRWCETKGQKWGYCIDEKLCKDLQHQKRVRAEKTESWRKCTESLKELEDSKLTPKVMTPCEKFTDERQLSAETMNVLKLQMEINSLTEKIRLLSNRVARAESKIDVGEPDPTKVLDMNVKKREEILNNLHVAAKSSKWAVQALCVLQNLLQKLEENPIGVVSPMELAGKNTEEVTKLVEESGFNLLAFGVAVNNVRKSVEVVKKKLTDSLTNDDDDPSSTNGRNVLTNAEKIMDKSSKLLMQLGDNYGLICMQR